MAMTMQQEGAAGAIGRRFAIVVMLLTVSGFFISTKGNPFGIAYFNEVATVLSLIFYIGGAMTTGRFRRFDLLVLMVPLIGCLASALLAKASYGQPLVYGLIEERRWLSLYLYFPLRAALAREPDPRFCLRAILLVAAAVGIAGYLYSADLVSGFRDLEERRTEFREDRVNFGTIYVATALILTAIGWRLRPRSWLDIVAALISLGFILFVAQTRQVIVGLSGTLLVYLVFLTPGRGRGILNLLLGAIVVPLLVILAYAGDFGLFDRVFALFSNLFEDNRLLENARAYSILTVWREFSLFGHGALSQQWNNGFLGMYGHFVLADLGFFGTLHRFGIMAAVVILLTLYMLFVNIPVARRTVGAQYARALLCCALFLVFMWPTGAILEHRAINAAMLLAMAALAQRAAMPRRTWVAQAGDHRLQPGIYAPPAMGGGAG